MAYENQKNDYLDGKTNMDIATEIVESFELLEDVSKKKNAILRNRLRDIAM